MTDPWLDGLEASIRDSGHDDLIEKLSEIPTDAMSGCGALSDLSDELRARTNPIAATRAWQAARAHAPASSATERSQRDIVPIGRAVRAERVLAGYSQAELAAAAAIDRTRLSRVETGSRELSYEEAVRLAAALRIGVESFARASSSERAQE